MQKLFFQLIQVSIGSLDCLERGPSNEEWYKLYNLSKMQGVEVLCHEGVVRLFDYGLRAPQDLSIDWMAESEREDEAMLVTDPHITNPLRKMLYLRWKKRNGSSLYNKKKQPQQFSPAAAVIAVLLQAFAEFHQGRLNIRRVVQLSLLLREADGQFPLFRDGSSVQKTLKSFGVWRFTQAMMWTIGEVTALDSKKMVSKMDASGGRFLLTEVMAGRLPLSVRIKNRLYKLFMF